MPGIAGIDRLGVDAARAKVLCVFVHGRNQSPEEMEAAVIARLSTPDVAFALPRAGDKCWYHALAVAPLTPEAQAELAASVADLAALVAEMRAKAPNRPLVLAGFSQGACLSLEYVFAGAPAPDAIVALTGCRVGQAGDARPEQMAPGLPVYLSAGDRDSWIPLTAFAEAAVELGRAQAVLRMDVFPGRAHEVSGAELAMLDGVLADLASGRAPRFEVPR